MQLKKKRAGQVRESLAAFSASLIAATLATHADPATAQSVHQSSANKFNDFTFGPGTTYSELDSALLVYQEAGGRVMAIEPTVNLSSYGAGGEALTLELTADAVSGATPNGAVPSDKSQNFVTPLILHGTCTTKTGASGGGQVVCLPPTQQQQAAAERVYTTPPNTLPVDKAFQDFRSAFSFGWSQPVGEISRVGFGGSYSIERDYQAIGGNVSIAQTFNQNNSTVSLSLNTEIDSSFPYGGVPTPFSPMSPQIKPVSTLQKTQLGFVAGLTEVMTRHWLMQINYSFDSENGYQNDPYRIISVVDPVSGEPLSYLYENRPGSRVSQSVFWDNKLDLGPTVTDLSLRYFKDSWGITSKTAELSERVNLSNSVYAEPSARWYQQSAANFFHNFLVNGQGLPSFATSDTRMSAFSSMTYAAKVGWKVTRNTELDLNGGYYQQTGDGRPADAIGQLKQQNLFGGTSAAFVYASYVWDFR